MKASVIIANYNNAKFVKDCINSLISQSYKNIEIIFFDDNSLDNSIKIVEKFENIKIIKNKEQTKFGSLNQMNAFRKAFELSTGDIIFLLDSDDYFHFNKIEKIINSFSEDKNKLGKILLIFTCDFTIFKARCLATVTIFPLVFCFFFSC